MTNWNSARVEQSYEDTCHAAELTDLRETKVTKGNTVMTKDHCDTY